ncbi:MAG: hypothetical protein VX865_01440 [Candidatus Thermoplasmatota archaeon]|nr:hypothetical protein [Candidatus Thermoplasmatota archaeon]
MVSLRVLEIPVSVTPADALRSFRTVCESRDWEMYRVEETRVVNRWAIIMPLTRSARVLGMIVEEEEVDGLSLRSWSFVPGSAGRVSMVSFDIPDSIGSEEWRDFLREWCSLLPRCPWKWTFWERSVIGYFIPEFRRSRVLFRKEGIDISSWTSSSQVE